MGKINLVGLEVEGGWDGDPCKRPFAAKIIADHSIDGRTVVSDKPLTCTHVGEVVSAPMFADRERTDAWITTHWPQHSNVTCGYHIHTSYASMKDYAALTTKHFLTKLVEAIVERGKELKLPPNHYLFKRMNGSNPFTLYNFDASNQIRMKAKSVGDRLRYGMINCAWNIHGTIEFRGYPTFETPELAKEFTNLYLDFIEDYLEEFSDKFAKVYSATLRMDCGELCFTLKTPKEAA
jgi:hypothetical protein